MGDPELGGTFSKGAGDGGGGGGGGDKFCIAVQLLLLYVSVI